MLYYCFACTEIRPGYADPFNCARCFSCFIEEYNGITLPGYQRISGCERLIPNGVTVAELDEVWYKLREKNRLQNGAQKRNIHLVRMSKVVFFLFNYKDVGIGNKNWC